jgi:hypothetical protein
MKLCNEAHTLHSFHHLKVNSLIQNLPTGSSRQKSSPKCPPNITLQSDADDPQSHTVIFPSVLIKWALIHLNALKRKTSKMFIFQWLFTGQVNFNCFCFYSVCNKLNCFRCLYVSFQVITLLISNIFRNFSVIRKHSPL